MKRRTQEQRILDLLESWEWISSLTIVKKTLILRYWARLYDLRQKWYKIETKMEYKENAWWDPVQIWLYKLIQEDERV